MTGLWHGFEDLYARGMIDRLPKLAAAEVHGSLAATLKTDADIVTEMPAAFDTLAVSIGTTRSTFQAVNVLRASGGTAIPVGNQGLVELQEQLARTEGIFAELTSVTPLAAIARLRRQNIISQSDRVIAVVTGSGLKDLDRSVKEGHCQRVFQSKDEALAYLGSLDAVRALGSDPT